MDGVGAAGGGGANATEENVMVPKPGRVIGEVVTYKTRLKSAAGAPGGVVV